MTASRTIQEMTALLEVENAALAEHRLADVVAGVPAKTECASRLSAEAGTSVVSTVAHQRAIRQLQCATERNERLLATAIKIQEQVMEIIKKSARDALPVLYNCKGREANADISHDSGSVIMRL